MPFLALGLTPALCDAVKALGFSEPTPIQREAIAPILRGSDVWASAQTGSGKTAAFALPLLQRLQALPAENRHQYGRAIRALIIVPTRELAAQVGEVVRSLAQALPHAPKVVMASGGVSINPQMMALRGGADVLVATPGRLLDLAKQNAIQLATVRILILDEADRLLDLGFADELARTLTLLPPSRQTLLFSATFPPEVRGLVAQMLNNPVELALEPNLLQESVIAQRAIRVDDKRRTQLLRHLVKEHHWTRVLVFVATKYAAELVAEKLYKAGVYATAFHGDLSQGARSQVLAEFKDEQWEVVITTDLASRGIDISKLPVVVNYDLPRSAVDYVHRIGRTGRAGETGLAVSFVGADALAHFALIQKRQGMDLPLETIAGFEPTDT
ncbi:MAG TPA: DEAD/DEAH box helicase, partial [Rhodoferax sp.]|nr:DEAD/DEAH box helicase [Rhodoferax sp.]